VAWLGPSAVGGGRPAAGRSAPGCLARPPAGRLPACWRVASAAYLALARYRPDVSLSWGRPQALAAAGILLPRGIRPVPPPKSDRRAAGHVGFRRSPLPWLASFGRCAPPGFWAVQAGPGRGLPAPDPLSCGLQRVSLLRWCRFHDGSTTPARALPIAACETGDPACGCQGSVVAPRCRPLQTSRRSGGSACTTAPGGRGSHPQGKRSDEGKGFFFHSRSTRKPRLPCDQRVAPRRTPCCSASPAWPEST
jgi:hypothetical protein